MKLKKYTDKAIVLTGTITPFSNFLHRSNTNLRVNDYLKALEYYDSFGIKTFFIENSGYDFSSNEEFSKFKNITLKSLPTIKDFNKGKGYQEFFTLQSFINDFLSSETYFIKITGRYILSNLKKILSKIDYSQPYFDISDNKKLATASIFCCSKSFFNQYLLNCYMEMNDSKNLWAEHILYRRLAGISQIRAIPFEPNFKGVSGSTGYNLEQSIIKIILKNIYRKSISRFSKRLW